ncbi:MAG: signal peptidase I [Deferribacteraceae bacterium]|jgi:signal peptidase I|nr:signal peptidase I [Deferribacteraceae bacterium]
MSKIEKNVDNVDNENPDKGKNSTRDFIDSLVIAFVIAMIIRTFLLSAYTIPSGSMLETLQIGDYLFVGKISYLLGNPRFGDVAVFEYPLEPEKDFIKRVMGVPGDKIKIVDRVVYRNGEPLDEKYKRLVKFYSADYISDNVPEFTVPEGQYLMMGDNRDESYDSRFWGFVSRKSFKGKALIIYWSKEPTSGFTGFVKGIRWDRLLNIVR